MLSVSMPVRMMASNCAKVFPPSALPVFPDKIKRDRRDFKSSMNSCLISLVIVVMGDDAPRIGDHSRDNDGNECGDDPSGLEKLAVRHGNSPLYLFLPIYDSQVLKRKECFAAPYWMGLCQTCGVGGLYLVPDRSQGIRRY